MKELQKRKKNRLAGYDYSQKGAYFITICSKDRKEMFGHIVGAVANRPPYMELSDIGEIIDKEIYALQEIRKNISISQYVIMPNHIHLIITIDNANGRLATAPTTTISEIIRLWKRAVSKQLGYSPWQKSFHDHIIRTENDFNFIAEYIDNNPMTWEEDTFHPSNQTEKSQTYI